MENPHEDTQWNDVLRQKGIIPPKSKEAEVTEEQIEDMVESVVKTYTSNEKRPEELNLDDLDGLEDELDEKIFLEYRQKRIAEMKSLLQASKFGDVIEITGKDYVQEVNKAGEGIWVVLHLYKQGISLSSLINEYIRNLAHKFPAVKFLKSLAGLCIPNYPDQNLPTIFVYLNGDLKHSLIGTTCFTSRLKQDELEWMLSKIGAFKTELETDPRPKIRDALFSQLNSGNARDQKRSDDSESEWVYASSLLHGKKL